MNGDGVSRFEERKSLRARRGLLDFSDQGRETAGIREAALRITFPFDEFLGHGSRTP
jgi:hypothetical protein